MNQNQQEPIKYDVTYDELSTRWVMAYVTHAREIIPERKCHKFTDLELECLPDDLVYVMDESVRSIMEYDDYDGFNSGYGN